MESKLVSIAHMRGGAWKLSGISG